MLLHAWTFVHTSQPHALSLSYSLLLNIQLDKTMHVLVLSDNECLLIEVICSDSTTLHQVWNQEYFPWVAWGRGHQHIYTEQLWSLLLENVHENIY